MTIKEIANILNVTEEAIKWHVRKLYPDLMKNGVTTFLSEDQVIEIKSKMIPTSQLVAAQTDKEMMIKMTEVMDWLRFKVSEQGAKIEEMKPKALFYDEVTGSPDAIDMGTAAKTLKSCIDKKIGRNELFEILRNKKILMRDNIPYQKYVDAGYFRTIEQKYTLPDGTIKINIKTIVLQAGIEFIRRVVSEYDSNI